MADITKDNLIKDVDMITAVFVLSALPPVAIVQALRNICKWMQPGTRLFFRDYVQGDLAEQRFLGAAEPPKLDEHLYVRADGTLSYFFNITQLRAWIDEASNGRLKEELLDIRESTTRNRYCSELINIQGNRILFLIEYFFRVFGV